MQNYKKTRADWIKISSDANKILRERDMSPHELSELASIDYHAARRMLLDGIINQTNSAIKVCIKLGLIDKSEKVQNLNLDDVYQVLKECWTENSAQAELLIKLIRSTANLKIHYR